MDSPGGGGKVEVEHGCSASFNGQSIRSCSKHLLLDYHYLFQSRKKVVPN